MNAVFKRLRNWHRMHCMHCNVGISLKAFARALVADAADFEPLAKRWMASKGMVTS